MQTGIAPSVFSCTEASFVSQIPDAIGSKSRDVVLAM